MTAVSNNVELIGTYGGDLEHALSAWTSTSRDLTEEKRARIPALLKQLAEAGHETPFEKSALHFLVTCDVATHIQLLKHRIGVSINAESARYRELKTRHYVPPDFGPWLADKLEEHAATGERLYHVALDTLAPTLGRARAKEVARYFLGYSNVTTMDILFNFRSFMHFQKLRNDEHAQVEIRDIAVVMHSLVRGTGKFTASLEAFGHAE